MMRTACELGPNCRGTCARCGEVRDVANLGLCQHCWEQSWGLPCESCGAAVHVDDAHWDGTTPYCPKHCPECNPTLDLFGGAA